MLDYILSNLLANNNISHCLLYCQISLQITTANCSFSDDLTPMGVTFILLATVLALLGVASYYMGSPVACYHPKHVKETMDVTLCFLKRRSEWQRRVCCTSAMLPAYDVKRLSIMHFYS